MIKQEVRRLSSQPGEWLFTWVKGFCMPWMLASIEPFEGYD